MPPLTKSRGRSKKSRGGSMPPNGGGAVKYPGRRSRVQSPSDFVPLIFVLRFTCVLS